MTKTSCEFSTSYQSTKSWFRTNGAIDQFMRIIDYNKFNKFNAKWSNYARLKYGTTGKLFSIAPTDDRAIPNHEVFEAIDHSINMLATPIIKEGVQEIFNSNPELNKIGTVEQYNSYLDTIFPDSKVKDIKQHATEAEFELFTKEGSGRLGKGFYFSDFGNNYIEGENVKKKLVLLNIKNPLNIQGGQFMKDVYKLLDDRNQSSDDVDAKIQAQKDINNKYKQKADALIGDKNGVLNSEIKVFEPEQIHILGNKQDIEGFKEFVKGIKSQSNLEDTTLTSQQVDTVKGLALSLASKYNVKVVLLNSDVPKAGWVSGGKVYINLKRVKADTPIHEFAHIFVDILKQQEPDIYRQLRNELLGSKQGRAVLKEVRANSLYASLSAEEQIEEAIVELIGKEGAKMTGSNRVLKSLIDFFIDFIAKVIKSITGVRIERNTTVRRLANKILYGTNIDLSEAVVGLDFSQATNIFDEQAETNDDSIVYTNKSTGKATLRSSFLEVLLSPFKGKYNNSYQAQAEKMFKSAGLDITDPNAKFNYKIGSIIFGSYSLSELAEYLKFKDEKARWIGKAVHKYFEFLATNHAPYKNEAIDLAKKAGMSAEELFTYGSMHSAVQGSLKKVESDITYIEKTLSMSMPGFEVTDENEAKVKIEGFSGTIDELIDHGDNVYTIVDYKTGHLDVIGHTDRAMKYSKDAGVNWRYDALHKNMLKTAFYTLLLRANNPQARMRNVYMAQVSGASDFALHAVDLEPAYKILSEYFKAEHYDFWLKNQNLFDYRTIRESKTAREVTARKEKNPNKTKGEALSDYKAELLAELNMIGAVRLRLLKSRADTGLSDKEQRELEQSEARYQKIVGELAEIDLGYDPIASGSRQGMDIITANLSNIYNKSNPLLEYFRTLLFNGTNKSRAKGFEVEKTHHQYLKALEEEYYKKQGNRKKIVGADYEEFYSFLWTMNKDMETYIRTYLDDDWNTLTQAQKDYADYYRHTLRYHLFLTMNPAEGIKFIEKELNERTDLSEEFRTRLNQQLEELNKQPKWDKFKQSRYPNFKYAEGWTPRVVKTAEENSSFKQYWKTAIDSTMTATDEDDRLHKTSNEVSKLGLPLRYFGFPNSAARHRELYTFNGELTLAYFVQGMLNKQYLDDVYNIGQGINMYWKNQDAKDESDLNQQNIKFLSSLLRNIVLQQAKDDFQGRSVKIPIINEQGKIETRKISIDYLVRFLRVTFAVPALALNILGAASTGSSQIVRLITQAATGSIAKRTNSGDAGLTVSDTAKSTVPLLQWIKDSMSGDKKLSSNKMELMMNYTTFRPSSYESNMSSKRRMRTTQGFIIPKKIDNELLLSLYSKVDNLIYGSYLYGALKGITWKDKDGKEWNMWDAYEVVDGELTYIGGPRGVDAISGKVIGELTAEELVKIKGLSERDMGSYREEERNALEGSALGLIYMTFKRWLPAIIKRAWMPGMQDATLGKWVNSGGAIDLETGLPVMTWLKEYNEGFMRSLLKAFAIGFMVLKDRERGSKDWKNLSGSQRQNIIFALSKLAAYTALILAISAIFGDADDDDDNKIKKAAINVAQDSTFEFIVFNPDDWVNTLLSVPSAENAGEFMVGFLQVIGNVGRDVIPGLSPNVVQSGPHEGWYKGTSQVLRNTQFLSIGYSLWELDNSWADLENEVNRLQ